MLVNKKLRVSDNYLYSSEEEQDQETIDANEFNESIIKKETDINRELFKTRFKIQSPSSMTKGLYKTNDKEKNRLLVSVINSGLKRLKGRN